MRFPKTVLNLSSGDSLIVLSTSKRGYRGLGYSSNTPFSIFTLLFFDFPHLPNSQLIKQNKKETVRIRGKADQRFTRVLRGRRIQYSVAGRISCSSRPAPVSGEAYVDLCISQDIFDRQISEHSMVTLQLHRNRNIEPEEVIC